MNVLGRPLGLVSIACALGAGTAHAGVASCTASTTTLGTEACVTASLAAHPRDHFVHVAITGEADWEVVDVTTGIVVGHGHTTALGLDRTIFGLAGRYTLRLAARAAHGTLTNR